MFRNFPKDASALEESTIFWLVNGPQIPIGSGVKKHMLEDAMLNPEATLSIH